MTKISWEKGRTQFLGRNGYFSCKGFEVERLVFENQGGYEKESFLKDVIRVWPVTSRGKVGRCFIEIPMDDILRFAHSLTGEAMSLGRKI